ncbi:MULTISPECIES: biliverdin-producing heme oxygenase [unclassified Sphingomonas]|uniref:biliverdin-producing heme oxygenase n=1 Tax=unclassified Sphingomonas TaxID=196159 RepID=UPI002151F0A7|nr:MULTISPECIES: biliverdin-producing heme oxygenase [unclassified Sphingomonas]MCR5870107.1 biliverdin-producing heme oxygenase [Sphingomonas sp. J344]UUX98202.1 biliverdin-producing heme oxygenase [Sphingomonas sp. J315]
MPPPNTTRSLLRSATASAHERVDHAFGGFDLSNRDGYRAFLIAQAQPLVTVEAAVDAFDPRAILPDWPERRRAPLIAADLADLDAPIPAPAALDLPNNAAALGAIYVLEGSRLGGALLARNVPMDLPGRFIRCQPAPKRWRSLIEVLDGTLTSGDQRDAAVGAARAVFDLFWRSARQHGRMPVVE